LFTLAVADCLAGAGKTSTLNMLTGVSSPDSGWALVGGFDTKTQLGSVWRMAGVMPQFDTVWDDSTVAEHLYFYARIKGVPYRRLRAEVQTAAEKTKLDGDAFKTVR
jgi:ABC-type multidrug transport system ATPase subunit